MKRSRWWRPDPGSGSPVYVTEEAGFTLLLQASVVALSDEAVQLAVTRPVKYDHVPTLAVFSLATGEQIAPSADVPSSWRVAPGWLDVIRQLATGKCCGNCGLSAKCMRRVCDGWKPMTKQERARRALPGPLERLEPNWNEWRPI